ncbi:MAG: hypothetical protein Q8Q80_01250 [Methyloversatilis sp.]|uniref:hypothetical protein n=1 Tax=Methyloversatilis sp. TaxID=2569862 RepID=UPI0027349218|nr:hypothetical protein [Methyloversatilis sp.]MDP3871263.1 hypothetical protein [Methyloversatilis sp.]
MSRDSLTVDMFTPYAVPTPHAPLPGALAFSAVLRGLLSEAIKASPLSREEIAARMSVLTGQEITLHMINAWTAESREGWRFPLEFAPAFEVATETHSITAWLADVRGGKLLVGRDAINAELGRLERMRDEAARRIKQLKRTVGDE